MDSGRIKFRSDGTRGVGADMFRDEGEAAVRGLTIACNDDCRRGCIAESRIRDNGCRGGYVGSGFDDALLFSAPSLRSRALFKFAMNLASPSVGILGLER